MTWIIEVSYNGGDTGETTELYGYVNEEKAKWDAQWLQEQIDKLPRDQNRWVTVSARPLTSLHRSGPAYRAIIAEATKFLEPSDEPIDESFRGMYSIDHGGSGS